MAGGQRPMGGEDQRFLARMRAGGEPDRAAGQQPRSRSSSASSDRQRRRGELQVARCVRTAAAPQTRAAGSASVSLRAWTRAKPPSIVPRQARRAPPAREAAVRTAGR